MNLGRTVAELKQTMSYQELYEWYDYYSEEPFLADRLEIQLATVCQIVGSFAGSKSKHKDFMISNKQKEPQSEEEKKKSLLTAFKSM